MWHKELQGSYTTEWIAASTERTQQLRHHAVCKRDLPNAPKDIPIMENS